MIFKNSSNPPAAHCGHSTGDFDQGKMINLEVMNIFVIFVALDTCAG